MGEQKKDLSSPSSSLPPPPSSPSLPSSSLPPPSSPSLPSSSLPPPSSSLLPPPSSSPSLPSSSPSCCCREGAFYVNVGVMGHVDSGKTSLVRELSLVRSTASLDKLPQSQERGITIDLGFTASTCRVPCRCSHVDRLSQGLKERKEDSPSLLLSSERKDEEKKEKDRESNSTGKKSHLDGELPTGDTSLSKDADVSRRGGKDRRDGEGLKKDFSKVEEEEEEEESRQEGTTQVQICWVDCPGHASLIRTIIGGAQIIDVVLLVLDVTKGIQTQTAECLVIAELLSRHLVVILNKIDLLPSSSRNEKIRSVSSKLRNVFSQTVFGSEIPIIPVAAHPRQEDEGGKTPLSSSSSSNWNVGAVIEALASLLTTQQRESLLPLSSSPSSPSFSCSSLLDKLWLDQRCEWNMIRGRRRNASTNDEKEERCICCERVGPVPPSPFYLVYDHCFLLKGKGTIFTGTVLSGCLHIGDSVCILTSSSPLGAAGAGAAAAASKGNSSSSFSSYKVKGLQTFHRQVESACRGQRVALCLTGVSGSDASHLERGALCDPQCVPPIADGCLAVVERIRFYKPSISSGMKFHCTVGHTTVMCVASFFGSFSSSEEEDEEKEKERDSRSTSCLTSTSVSYSSLNVGRLISGGPSESYASPEDHKRNARQPSQRSSSTWPETIDLKCTYTHLDELVLLQQDERKGKERRFAGDSCQKQKSPAYHDMRDELPQEKKKKERLRSQFAILSFEKPIIVPSRSVFICSKLDMDTSSPQCRLAFFGNMLTPLTAVPPPSQGLSQNEKKKSSSHSTTSFKAPMPSIFYHPYVQELPVYKPKKKTGYVERFVFDPPCKCGGEGGGKAVEKTSEASACKAFSLIGRSLFKSSQHVSRFVGFKVKICPRSAETDNGYTEKDEEKQTSKKKKEDCHVGTIEKAFGNKGKFIVQLTEGMSCNELRSIHGAEEGTEGVSKTTGFEIILEYRKKVYDKTSDTLTQKDS